MTYHGNGEMELDTSFDSFSASQIGLHHQQQILRDDDRRNAAGNSLTQPRMHQGTIQSFANSASRNSYILTSNVGKYSFLNTNGNFAADGLPKHSEIDDGENSFWTQKFDKDNYLNSKNHGNDSLLSPTETSSISMSSTYENNGYNTNLDVNPKDSGTDKKMNSTCFMKEDGELIGSLRLQLQIKETQNECLENEIQKFKTIFDEGLNYKQIEYKKDRQNRHVLSERIEIPDNLELIFRSLSETLRQKEEELAETKQSLEAILTALALDPSNSITRYGRYDAENISHKMVVRLETLTNENKEMAKMLAYGRSKEAHIELQIVNKENVELKAKVSYLQKKLKTNQ